VTVKPPMNGAIICKCKPNFHLGVGEIRTGPRKISVAKTVSAVPRVSLSNISAYTEAVRATGADPKTAMKNRDIMSV
jgi:hypothetical protein